MRLEKLSAIRVKAKCQPQKSVMLQGTLVGHLKLVMFKDFNKKLLALLTMKGNVRILKQIIISKTESVYTKFKLLRACKTFYNVKVEAFVRAGGT